MNNTVSGPISLDNPLKYAAYYALASGEGSQVLVTSVADPGSKTAWEQVIDLISERDDVFHVFPLTGGDKEINDSFYQHIKAMNVDETAKERVLYLLAHDKQTNVVLDSVDDYSVSGKLGSETGIGQIRYITYTADTAGVDFAAAGVKSGDTVRTGYDFNSTGESTWKEYTVESVINSQTLRLKGNPDNIVTDTVSMIFEIWRTKSNAEFADLIADTQGYSDRKYLQDRIGFLSKTTGRSTAEYKAFANLAIDTVVEGTSDKRLNQLIGTIFDAPVSKERETVQVIGVGEKERWLATDKNVYFTELSAEWTVKAGDVIKPGTFLTDGVLPITGRMLPDNVPIVLERRFLGHTYQSGLVFDNKDVRLNTNPSEKHITFDITGQESDKRRFWDEMYKRSADPMFLYNASSGGWINPAKFIYENILYPNCRLYVVKNKTLGKDKLPMSNTSVLRNLLPPGVIFSILFESNKAETEFGLDLNTSGVCGYAYPKKNTAVDMNIGGATIKVC